MREILAVLLLLSCAACATAEPWVELKGKKFTVEIADTRDKQTQGLMFRNELPKDHGMLFIFADESPRSFWMRNTRIALDILYFNSRLELVSVAENARPCRVERCPGYPSKGPARYVLEINAGLGAELDVREGDVLTLHLD